MNYFECLVGFQWSRIIKTVHKSLCRKEECEKRLISFTVNCASNTKPFIVSLRRFQGYVVGEVLDALEAYATDRKAAAFQKPLV